MTPRILLLGSKRLGVGILGSITGQAPGAVCAVITVDDRADARSEFSALAALAADRSIPLHVARDRTHADDLVRLARPDLCVVACWYWLLSPELLRLVPRGFIGIHNSLLPKYRGGSPLVWALINNDSEVGASIFSLRDGVDDGPVWLQVRVPVGPEEPVGVVLDRLETETLRVFRDGFPSILNGELTPHEQDHRLATYCGQRLPEDGEIDWSRPAVDVLAFIRAQSPPYPGAFTFLDGRKLTILRAGRVETRYHGTPGQVAGHDGTGVITVCGASSALRLDEVDLGAGPTPATHALKAVRVRFPPYPVSAVLRAFGAESGC